MEDDFPQKQHQQDDEFSIKRQFWSRWIEWMSDVRRQRHMALRVLKFQNQSEDRLLRRYFDRWSQFNVQERISRLNLLKQSVLRQQDQCYDERQIYSNGLAIKYHERKMKSKSFRAWIEYGIECKRFQKRISNFYIKFILKKYIGVLGDFAIKNKEKKLKKTQTVVNDEKKAGSLNSKQEEIDLTPQLNYIKTGYKQSNQTYQAVRNQPKRALYTDQNFGSFVNQSQSNELSNINPVNSNTLYNFNRNKVLGQSRRSEFSSISSQFDYQSKRKFRPITELPSIPDIDGNKRMTQNTEKQKYSSQSRSPVKAYDSRAELFQQDGTQTKQNVAESKFTSISNQDILKSKILQLIIKEKLITNAILSGEQFEHGMEYQNYRQRNVNSLRKLKELKTN